MTASGIFISLNMKGMTGKMPIKYAMIAINAKQTEKNVLGSRETKTAFFPIVFSSIFSLDRNGCFEMQEEPYAIA